MAEHRIRLAVHDFSQPSAGGLVVLHAGRDELIAIPVNVVGHETGSDGLAQNVRRIRVRERDYRTPAKGNNVELLAITRNLQAIVARKLCAPHWFELEHAGLPLVDETRDAPLDEVRNLSAGSSE